MPPTETDLDRLQQELARCKAELERSEDQLERVKQDFASFAYAVSHDLQEPLRMVSSYTQLLARRYSQDLDQSALDFIHYAVDGASRMQGMINDLLTFSRVNTRGQPFEPTDLQEVVHTVQAELQDQMDRVGAVLECTDLPVVYADSAQMRQLITHLVHNALTFCSQEAPRMRLWAIPYQQAKDAEIDAPPQERWRISLADNGLGIDPKFHAAVFDTFRQLHPREKYPGTGMGLAICRQIVLRHGGRIWVESEPKKGAIFHLTLPQGPSSKPL